MANRPIFAVQRFDCKLRTCKEQINDLNIIHKESHPSIYYLANWGEILHQSKNFYREFWKIPCFPLSYCCPNIKSNTTSKISFLHPGRFLFHSIADVRGYQTLEGFQNMFAMSFGTNASAPTAFSQFLEICTGLRCIFSKALHHFRIVAVDDAIGKAVCEVFSGVGFCVIPQPGVLRFCKI